MFRENRPASPHGSAPAGARDCHLYRFYVRDPRTNYQTKTLGYIGETVRAPFARLMEHIKAQPWADTIVGWEVDDAVYAGKDAVLEAERAAVEAERPLYNYEWNLDNPERVEIWKAKEQRAARDAAAGKQTWQPGERDRAYRAPAPRSAPARRPPREPRREVLRPPTLPPRWRRRRNEAAAWTAAWLVLAGTLWWLAGVLLPEAVGPIVVDDRARIVGAVAVATLLPVVTMRRKRHRKAALGVLGVLTVALYLAMPELLADLSSR
ncbi:MAG TPA: hypothetical protein VK453_25495 [Micromonosporaceae bacterium]|nr:hypothetical protein [Micromonosporaceae bacterium]